MKVAAIALLALGLSGCFGNMDYQAFYDGIPQCPDAGLSYFEVEVHARADQNASAAFSNRGWENISVRYEGAGGFGDPESIRLMSATCDLRTTVDPAQGGGAA